MTERPPRTKPAVAAKVMVTGASLTSVLVMTAAMGSAAKEATDESNDQASTTGETVDANLVESTTSTTVVPRDTTIMVLMADGQLVPLPADLFSDVPPSAPVVGRVVESTTTSPVTSAPASSEPETTVPVAVPTPVIVQVPTPAPAPSASTNKSR